MASIINSSVTGGLTLTADSSTDITLKSSGTTVLTLSGNTVTANNLVTSRAVENLQLSGTTTANSVNTKNIVVTNTFGGPFNSGLILDYNTTSSKARFSVGSGAGIIFYTGGLAQTPVLNITATANIITTGTFFGSAQGLTNLPSQNVSGIFPVTSLGSGTANTNNFLRGDGQWAYVEAEVANVPTEVSRLSVGTNFNGMANGQIRATNSITSYYSDERLKVKLGNIENAVEKIKSLDGFYYKANELAQSLGYDVKTEVGVSAQQVQKVLPEVVVPAPIDDKYLTVHYERIVPLLIEAVKEQQSEIDKLKSLVQSLMAQE